MPLDLLADQLSARLAAGLFLKASLILGAAWLAAGALRRAAAAARYAVWTAAFVALLALPALGITLPRWNPWPPPLPRPTVAALPPLASAAPASATPAAAPGPVPAEPLTLMTDHPSRRGSPPWGTMAAAIWALGVVTLLVRLGADLARARALRRDALAIAAAEPAAALARRLTAELGVMRRVDVALSANVEVPVTWGVLRPVVLLPVDAVDWTEARLRAVLVHELAHVARFDYLTHLVARLARAVYWPNPAAWLAADRAAVEQERACDDTVLRLGGGQVDYAQHLVDIARRYAPAREARVGALAMARPHTLPARVRAILDGGTPRDALARRAALATTMGAALLVGPLATVRVLGEGREATVRREAVRDLAAGPAATRAQAAWTLGATRARGAVDSLLPRLADPDPAVRGMTAWALGAVGGRRAHGPLVAALDDPEPYVREMAVIGLGDLGDRGAVPALAGRVRDPASGVRSVLTTALRRLGGLEAAALLGVLARGDDDAHTRLMAIDALGAWGEEPALTTLLAVLRAGDPNDREVAATRLADFADGRAVAALSAAATDDPVSEVRACAIRALRRLGDPRGREAMLVALRGDTAYGVRVNAAYGLGELGGPTAAAALIAATRDPVHQVRLASVEALETLQGR